MSKSSDLAATLKAGSYAGRSFQPEVIHGTITTAELHALACEVGLPMKTARTVARAVGLHEQWTGHGA